MLQPSHALLPRATAILLASALLTGCNTMTNTEQQGTGFGALAGGLLGAVVAKQTGGNSNQVLAGAVIGAALGAMAGHSWANSVERARSQYRTEEERLAATIQASDQIQVELTKENDALAARVATSKANVDQLKASFAANQATQQQLASEKKRVDQQRQQAASKRADLEKAIATESDQLAKSRAAQLAKSDELAQRIDAQQKLLASWKQSEADLLAQSESLSA